MSAEAEYPDKTMLERTAVRSDFRRRIQAAESVEVLLDIEARIVEWELAEDAWLNEHLEAAYKRLGAD